MFQTLVDVVGFGESKTTFGTVYYAMIHGTVTPAVKEEETMIERSFWRIKKLKRGLKDCHCIYVHDGKCVLPSSRCSNKESTVWLIGKNSIGIGTRTFEIKPRSLV